MVSWERCFRPKGNMFSMKDMNRKILFLILFSIPLIAIPQFYSWFAISSPILIKDKIRKCTDYKASGNESIFKACLTSTLNAYDFLIKKTEDENAHEVFWSMCSSEIQYDFDLGARCMTAAIDICKLTPNKQLLVDQQSCYRIFNEHTWVANPAAHKLDFRKPIRKEEEISKYVQ